MYNTVLHLLTNRITGFVSNIFPTVSVYTPHTESIDEAYLRSFLKLRQGDPEYYVVAMLAAIKSFPEIEAEFKEDACTYDLNDYRRSEFSVTNGTLVSAFEVEASVAYAPSEFPAPTTTKVTYYDNSEVRIVRGRTSYLAPYQIRTGNLLRIDWPAAIGISGIIDLLGNTWGPGIPITFTHAPDIFPYGAMADAAIKDNRIFQHMATVSTLKMFNAAQSSIEQGAILGLSVSTPWNYVT